MKPAKSAELGDDAVSYTFRPSLLGAPWEFTLTANAIEWHAGRQSGRLPLGQVRSVRMSYRPANMQSYRFVTEIWGDGAPKLQIVSTSWKSMFSQERLDGSYSGFVAELHRRLAQSGAVPRYLRGGNLALYWAGAAVFASVMLCLVILTIRALQSDAIAGAVFIAVFIALFGWHGGNFLRRNKPGSYSADGLPQILLP